ncbi:choice-of-anchor Q domain-containing protein [Dokdonella sp. MW10]|uniref:choice-of-anchor Q domain-containing protein n=1 Tax=Dokdonella sp. MW10 TaxID=2992926 RepID=UPI003F81F682
MADELAGAHRSEAMAVTRLDDAPRLIAQQASQLDDLTQQREAAIERADRLESSMFSNNKTAGSNASQGDVGLVFSRRPVGSGRENIAGEATCFATSAALKDRVDLDRGLADLADNGGPTKTMELQPASPAIDQVIVNAAGHTGTDQHGFARPSGTRCDIGAYERDGDRLFANGFE